MEIMISVNSFKIIWASSKSEGYFPGTLATDFEDHL